MNCFKRLSERRLIRRIEKLRLGEGEPIVKKLHQSVLYEKDARSALQYYVNLSERTYNSHLLRLACGGNNDDNHYWLYIKDGLYYAVQIGLKSKIFIGRTLYIPYVAVDFAYLEVHVKDCSYQLWSPSELYGYFIYSAKGLQPIALMLRGRDVSDFDESVWSVKVNYEPKRYQLEGYDCYGCKGDWYDVWFSAFSRKPIFDREEAERLPINHYERWFKGEKIIRQFGENERPSMQDMLIIWKMFIQ